MFGYYACFFGILWGHYYIYRQRHRYSMTKQRSSSLLLHNIILTETHDSIQCERFNLFRNISNFQNTNNTSLATSKTYTIYWFNNSNTKTAIPSFKWVSRDFRCNLILIQSSLCNATNETILTLYSSFEKWTNILWNFVVFTPQDF